MKVIVCSQVVSHVGQHDQVLADGEEGVDARLAVLVVPVVEVEGHPYATQVGAQNDLLEEEAELFQLGLLGPPESVHDDKGLKEVEGGEPDEAAEADLVQKELLLGRGEGEEQEGQVLQDVGQERRPD